MTFFDKILSIFRKAEEPIQPIPTCEEHKAILAFEKDLDFFMHEDDFKSRKEYQYLCDKHHSIYRTIEELKRTKTLNYFCGNNQIPLDLVTTFIAHYEDLAGESQLMAKHNDEYIANHLKREKSYLDSILYAVDPKIRLDEEQRKVVLSDDDYTLVVAGAGAGKTTTVAAKVKYLVEKQGIKPNEILVISFTNKAVGELQEKINGQLNIPCPITTFHKTGYAILKRQDNDLSAIKTEGFRYEVINNYLKNSILQYPELVDKLILFFGSYFDAPYEGDDLSTFFNYLTKADFSTIKGNIQDYSTDVISEREGKERTINYEKLRSAEEVKIANYLFMNGIEYEYEKPYPYNITGSQKIYTPDFTITQGDKVAYIEHFGITESGHNNRYNEEQLERYKKAVNDKITLHRRHKTDLIYTFSQYNDGEPFLTHLEQQLVAHGFVLNPLSSKEVFEKIVSTEENKYIARLTYLISTFIQNFKTDGRVLDDFQRFRNGNINERSKLFLTICEQCYLEYVKRLKEENAIDFEDMINESARIIRDEQLRGDRLEFKYIIVDEYQDISRQRFNLTLELSKLCNAKIIAVGDDWQSIYAFSGSDVSLFTRFKESFGYGSLLKIVKTYRNAQEIIDIAGNFVQKNATQITKDLISPKHIKDPVIIETYTENVDRKQYEGKGGKFYLVGETVERIMKQIFDENPKSSILILGRYGFDARNLSKSADFEYNEKMGSVVSKTFKDFDYEYMTVHKSKGLGYDNVIIINAMDAKFGFPSRIEDDPVLKFVVHEDDSIEFAEERRLFYVALTRTKNRVYIVTPQQRPSPFVRELVHDYPNVVVHGQLDESTNKDFSNTKFCPICGYPMQLKYNKVYKSRLWLCMNEPEVCGFITNDRKGGIMTILKCGLCKDGYLIVKTSTDSNKQPFLGCTNYNPNGTGCNNTIPYRYYKKHMPDNMLALYEARQAEEKKKAKQASKTNVIYP